MTSQIVKVRSNESGNFNRLVNKMTFQIPSDGTTYNLRDSYLLLNMSVTEPTTNQISFGQDNLPMDAVCLVKRAKLTSSKRGVIEEIQNVHILRENLNYWQKGENQDKSRALFGYSDGTSLLGGVVGEEAFFTDQPKNTYIWMKDIFGIGSLSALPSDSVGELTVELELENLMNPFQQIVENEYELNIDGQDVACGDVAHNTAVITPANVADLAKFKVGQLVEVVCTINAAQAVLERYVIAVGAANITVNAVLDAVNDAADVSLNYQSGQLAYLCNPQNAAIGQVTIMNGVLPYSDLRVGMKCMLQYATVVAATGALVAAAQQVSGTITAINTTTGQVTFSNIVGGNAPAVAAPAAGNQYTAISFIPLAVNLNNAVWNILKAECILYKLVGIPKSEAVQVFSTWKWEARQALANLTFEDTFRLESNVYNVYVMTPLNGKIYSVADGIENYRFFVDDQSVFDRDVNVLSSLHTDNMLTAFSNSQDGIKNLRNNKIYRTSQYLPYLTPCKIYQRSVNGAPNYIGEQGLPRQLKVYLDSLDTQKMVYVFKEQFVSL